jgi:riboflavin synthase
MFTGLVRAIGQLERTPTGVRVRCGEDALEALGPMRLGDSIAVDGVCLTVAEGLADGFRADVSEETLCRSTLERRAAARGRVNLEPALRLADRLGEGVVRGIRRLPGSWLLDLAWCDPSWGRYVGEKASIAVDGISLTVAETDERGATFRIAVIPHTWTSTTLEDRIPGDAVNLEADLLAKYVERLLHREPSDAQQADPPLTAAWLAEMGWGRTG